MQVSASISAITLLVSDVAASSAWYQNVFGTPVVFADDSSAVLQFDNTLINLLADNEGPALLAPATAGSAQSGERTLFSIWLTDIDTHLAALAARGVRPISGPVDRPWAKRTANLADPDGHLWELAQDIE